MSEGKLRPILPMLAGASSGKTLEELEQTIERGLETFVDVGRALGEICERKLYRERGYKTFAEYCKEQWGWTRQNAYDHIKAASASENVRSILQSGNKPPNYTQSIQLAKLPPEKQREVAERVDFEHATVRDVREEVKILEPKRRQPLKKQVDTLLTTIWAAIARLTLTEREIYAVLIENEQQAQQWRKLCEYFQRVQPQDLEGWGDPADTD